ncbi:MAG: PilZ domain-containing protein, partial [Sandaracinaceae bacterium]|nr:PilZ domain-containing protein [Sandaracinaceae bacterium]
MQAANTERRAKATRVPLDLWIRLAHEDFDESFDADAVDLSEGGLALRAEYLPEIGDRLRCQFESPPTGAEIEVGGEVVWAHEAGERSGEFGIRFDPLDEHMQESLQELVRHLGGGDAARVARLHLDGVATPIEAEVLEQEARWLTVEQELPFLQVGMGVTLEGAGGAPRGRLASVDLRVVDGTPRLVLAVELAAAEALAPAREDTFDEDEPVAYADAHGEEAYGEDAYGDAEESEDAPYEAADDRTMQDEPLPEALRGEAPPRDDVRVFAIADGTDEALVAPEDLAPEDTDAPVSALDRVRALMVRAAPAWARAR